MFASSAQGRFDITRLGNVVLALPGPSAIPDMSEEQFTMRDSFLDDQWGELNERVRRSVGHISSGDSALSQQFQRDAQQFAAKEPPESYSVFLDRVCEAAKLAVEWQQLRDERTMEETPGDQVELGSEESDPASDRLAPSPTAA